MKNITVKEIASHRNGVHGAPFNIVTFRDNKEKRNMVAIVFDSDFHIAVFDTDLLGQGNITFGENSWRGDTYEYDIRKAIKENDKKIDAEIQKRMAKNDY